MIKELIEKNRSVRSFYREETLTMGALKSFVNLARLSTSVGNLQSLKYILSAIPEKNEVAYIIILGDLRISKNFG